MSALQKMISGAIILMALSTIPANPGKAQNELAAEGPETIILDSLAQYYEPVEFNHALHLEFAENACSRCHHHTIGTPSTTRGNCGMCHKHESAAGIVACRDCHLAAPYSAGNLKINAETGETYHREKPSLKGAYHQLCVSCHEEMDGPASCDGCHARTDQGDAFFHAGPYAPAPNENHGGEE